MQSPLRVLMLGWEYPPHWAGGLGKACLGLAEALSHHVDLTLLVPRAPAAPSPLNYQLLAVNGPEQGTLPLSAPTDEAAFSKVAIKTLVATFKPYDQPPHQAPILEKGADTTTLGLQGTTPYGDNFWAELLRFTSAAVEAAQHLDFDVIHAHDWMTYPAAQAIQKASGKPWVAHVHSLQSDRLGLPSKAKPSVLAESKLTAPPASQEQAAAGATLESTSEEQPVQPPAPAPELTAPAPEEAHPQDAVMRLEQEALQTADRVIPVSHYTKEKIVAEYGISADKILPVYNALQQDETWVKKRVNPKHRYVFFASRMSAQKGLDTLIETAAKLCKALPDVHFLIAGAGEELRSTMRKGQRAGISDKLHFLGFLDQAGMSQAFSEARVFFMPSISEPFGLVAVEAAKMGVPLVISKESGIAEVITAALKAPSWDADQFTDQLYSILEYPVLHQHLAEKAAQEVATLSWENSAQSVTQIYQELLVG